MSPIGNTACRSCSAVRTATASNLVLVVVDGTAQSAVRQPGIVSGGQCVETQRQCAGGQGGELDSLVAAHAGIRRLAPRIGLDEVVDHVLFEPVGEIPDVERDLKHVGNPAGVASAYSFEQQPREPVRSVPGAEDSARCTPTTSCPASTILAAATEESTPPLIATRTRMASSLVPNWPTPPGGRALPRRAAPRGPQRFVVGAGVPQRQPQRAARARRIGTHRGQNVRGLRHARGARRTGGALNPLGVQQHQQRVALTATESEVRVARQPGSAGRTVDVDVLDRREHAFDETVAQLPHPSDAGFHGVHRGALRRRPSP